MTEVRHGTRNGAGDAALLELTGVAVGYAAAPILRDVDLRIDAGEIVGIVGASGSGKSTLLRAAVGLLRPRAGQVRLFGEDLYAAPERRRGRLLTQLGLLFQGGALFGSMSVLDNVMFPARKLRGLSDPIARELALIKLAQVGVAKLAERMPHDLSGGEAKRVALARANVLDPRLLLCDEPTSGLDPANAALLARLLARARERDGVAVGLVTHDMDLVRQLSDRAVVIAAGGIRAAGRPAELAASDDPLVRRLFEVEAPVSPGEEASR
jgi:phospholipid/cholesterol/gamma-HCH transport system ATP-binding protein